MKLSKKIGLAVVAFCILALLTAAVSAADLPGQGGHIPPGQGNGTAGNVTREGNNPPDQWPGNPAGQGAGNQPGQWPGNPPGQGHGNGGNVTSQGQSAGRGNFPPGQGNAGNITPRGRGNGFPPGHEPGSGNGNITSPENRPGQGRPITTKLINQLEEKGYNVSEVKTALQNQDVNATRAWVDAFRQNNPGVLDRLESVNTGQHQGNATETGPLPERHVLTPEILAQLEQKGYDVSAVQTSLQNQDVNATRAWVDAFRLENPGVLENIQQEKPVQGNTTDNRQDAGLGRQSHIFSPEFIQKLQKDGYNISEVRSAVQTWLSGFMKSGGQESSGRSTQ